RVFGGRARTQLLQGARLNLGPHAMFRDGELWAALKELGVRIAGRVPSPRAHGLWRGKAYVLPTTPGALAFSTLLDVKGKAEFARIITELRRLDPGAVPAGSFDDWVDGVARHPMVRSLLHTFVRTATYC